MRAERASRERLAAARDDAVAREPDSGVIALHEQPAALGMLESRERVQRREAQRGTLLASAQGQSVDPLPAAEGLHAVAAASVGTGTRTSAASRQGRMASLSAARVKGFAR